jgi:hypothetical protein
VGVGESRYTIDMVVGIVEEFISTVSKVLVPKKALSLEIQTIQMVVIDGGITEKKYIDVGILGRKVKT